MKYILQSKWKTEEIEATKITFNMNVMSIESKKDLLLIKFRSNFKTIKVEDEIIVFPSNMKVYIKFNGE